MKKRVFLALFFVLFSLPLVSGDKLVLDNAEEPMVWVCTGTSADRFHKNKSCVGLQNCTHSIEKVALSKAHAKQRTACKRCWKNPRDQARLNSNGKPSR